MTRSPTAERVSLTRFAPTRPFHAALADDVRRGLTGPQRLLPSRYLYDARGSERFERITQLDEYYLTRTETEILAANADAIVGTVAPYELVELGSGSSTKAELLLGALRRVGGSRYAALEISEPALVDATQRLAVFSSQQGPSGRVFDREVDGQVLTFDLDGDAIVDRETGSTWSLAGVATDGSLAGAQLVELPSRTSFWFAFASAFPDVEVVTP